MQSYLGWEQEFFVMPADLYKARPDLVNCGRTLFGKLPTRHQQGDLNYFQPIPGRVQDGTTLLDGITIQDNYQPHPLGCRSKWLYIALYIYIYIYSHSYIVCHIGVLNPNQSISFRSPGFTP